VPTALVRDAALTPPCLQAPKRSTISLALAGAPTPRQPLSTSAPHRLHSQNRAAVSAAVVQPPQLSAPFRDLLSTEYGLASPDAFATQRNDTFEASEDERPSREGGAWSAQQALIEMASIRNGAAPAEPPVHAANDPFAPGSASFDSASADAPGDLKSGSVQDFATLTGGVPSPSKPGALQSSSASKHALDGVIVMGANGIPVVIENGEAREVALFDVPEQQRERNAATLRGLGLGGHNVRQKAGVERGSSATDMEVVGEHTSLFMPAGHVQGSSHDGTPEGSARRGSNWFGAQQQPDELPLMGGQSSSLTPDGSGHTGS